MSDFADKQRLDDLANSILDGQPIDWEEVESGSSDRDRSLMRRLRLLSVVVDAHRRIGSALAVEASQSAGWERLPLPSRWGPLDVLEHVGRGSFGDVYRAWDPRLDREVALKLVSEQTSGSARSPVVVEGRLLARVRHANVLSVYGAERIDGRAGIWTEFIRGETLADEVARRGPLSANEAVRIGADVCRALDAVHAAGLLHRDVKAQNILRDGTGRLVLSDFGTGVELDEHMNVGEPRLAGTPLYLAPEILDGKPATAASDLYSVGVLLFFLLSGDFPVRGRTLGDIRRAHATGQHVTLQETRADVPEPLARLVDRALERDPARRQTSANEMAAALAAASEPSNTAWRKRVRPLAAVAGTVVAVIGLTALLHRSTVNRQSSVPRTQMNQPAPSDVELRLDASAAVADGDNTSSSSATAPAENQGRVPFHAGDWAVVAGFENNTDEAVLDGTLAFALERELSNSAFVSVAPRERLESVLQLIGMPIDVGKVDDRTWRDVSALDHGIRAVVSGRVERPGPSYSVSVRIVNPADGGAVANLRDGAPSQSDLLAAVRRLAFQVREALGEKPSSIEDSRTAIERAKHASLRGLQLYSRAVALMSGDRAWKHEPAEQLLKEALRQNPEFPPAEILLAWALHNQQRPKEDVLAAATRALKLADRALPIDRHFILGSYHSLLAETQDADAAAMERRQAISAYQALVGIAPGHPWGWTNLVHEYDALNLLDDLSDALARRADASGTNVSGHLAAADMMLRRGESGRARTHLDRAEAILASAGATKRPDLAQIEFLRVKAAFLERDAPQAHRAVVEAERRVAPLWLGDDDMMEFVRGELFSAYTNLGRLGDARRIAENSPPALRPRLAGNLVLTTAQLSEPPDRETLWAYWSKRLVDQETASKTSGAPGVEGMPYYVKNLVDAGLIDEVRRSIMSVRDNGQGIPHFIRMTIEGEFAMAEGRIDEGIRQLQAARADRPPDVFNIHSAILLADTWVARGQLQDAVSVLESATRDLWSACVMAASRCMMSWMRASERLSAAYRQAGKTMEAEVVDADLSKLLSAADPDYPPLVRLNARRRESGLSPIVRPDRFPTSRQ